MNQHHCVLKLYWKHDLHATAHASTFPAPRDTSLQTILRVKECYLRILNASWIFQSTTGLQVVPRSCCCLQDYQGLTWRIRIDSFNFLQFASAAGNFPKVTEGSSGKFIPQDSGPVQPSGPSPCGTAPSLGTEPEPELEPSQGDSPDTEPVVLDWARRVGPPGDGIRVPFQESSRSRPQRPGSRALASYLKKILSKPRSPPWPVTCCSPRLRTSTSSILTCCMARPSVLPAKLAGRKRPILHKEPRAGGSRARGGRGAQCARAGGRSGVRCRRRLASSWRWIKFKCFHRLYPESDPVGTVHQTNLPQMGVSPVRTSVSSSRKRWNPFHKFLTALETKECIPDPTPVSHLPYRVHTILNTHVGGVSVASEAGMESLRLKYLKD